VKHRSQSGALDALTTPTAARGMAAWGGVGGGWPGAGRLRHEDEGTTLTHETSRHLIRQRSTYSSLCLRRRLRSKRFHTPAPGTCDVRHPPRRSAGPLPGRRRAVARRRRGA
jgi:hypothetical protein